MYIFNARVLIIFPFLVALSLHFLGLSSYYSTVLELEYIFLFVSVGFFCIGLILVESKTDFIVIYTKLDQDRVKKTSNIIFGTGIFIFLIEALVNEVPLLSGHPSKAYNEFGLPFIHHFVNNLIVGLFLSGIRAKITGKKFLFRFHLLLAITIFILLTARLSFVYCIMVYFYLNFYDKKLNIYTFLISIVLLTSLIGIFIIVGNVRNLSPTSDFLSNLTGISLDDLPVELMLPYMYITAGVENTLNIIRDGLNFAPGLNLSKLIPKFPVEELYQINFETLQFKINFTTFMFPASFLLEFSFFAPIICLLFGLAISLAHRAASRSIFISIIFYSYILPVCSFLFFADNFFNTVFVFFIITASFASYLIKIRK